MVFMVVRTHVDFSSLPLMLTCTSRLWVFSCASTLQHRGIIIFVISNDTTSLPITRPTLTLIISLAACSFIDDCRVSIQVWSTSNFTIEEMDPIPGELVPTHRTCLLTAFCAAVQSQLVMLLTQVAFGCVCLNLYEVGVESR